MKREVIATREAPAAVGPYSQAIRVGDFVFTAGQLAIDPATGKLVEGGIEEQTRQVLRNITAVLEAAGSSLDKVMKTTVFLKDMGDFKAMNGVYASFFANEPPARSTVEVANLPLGALVEVDTIAIAG
ncbi:MAG: RidA family protein [Anaerolineales bacterium]|nr:RidA family protein [Anaerolineales bacterium]